MFHSSETMYDTQVLICPRIKLLMGIDWTVMVGEGPISSSLPNKAMLTFKQTAIIVLLSKTGLVNATA